MLPGGSAVHAASKLLDDNGYWLFLSAEPDCRDEACSAVSITASHTVRSSWPWRCCTW